MLVNVERGLLRFHRNLRLIALGAPEFVIAESQRLLDLSIAETGITEAGFAKLYPKFRIVAMVREVALAQEVATDGYDELGTDDPADDFAEPDPAAQGAAND